MENVEWGEFKLGDLFEVNDWKYGKNKKYVSVLKEPTSKSVSVISGITENNGVNYYTEDALSNDEIFEAELTISTRGEYSGTVFYHREKFVLANNILVMEMPNLSKNQKQFIGSLINSLSYGGYSGYPRKETLNEDKIKLPTKNGKIDFDFMESFIAELETERIAKLEAYLTVTGLKDYTLTVEEEKVLDNFKNIEWCEFKIGSLFDKLNLRTLKRPFDKLSDTSNIQTEEFNLPLVNAKFGNNGIMFYGREKDFDSAEMTIDVISNGAIATGTVYAQPYKTGILWDAYLLKPKVVDISKQKLLFFTTSLEKSIKLKFGWDNKAVWSKVQYQLLSLPTQNKQPNYAIMETLISAIQKLVIKELVLYVEGKMAATKKEVVNY